nr:PREDICTED: clustered mitochondria protein homolog [Macaca fascicularis]
MFLNGNCLESLKKEEPEGGRRRLSHPGNMGWMRPSQEMTPLNRSHYSGFGLFCGDPGPEIGPFSLQPQYWNVELQMMRDLPYRNQPEQLLQEKAMFKVPKPLVHSNFGVAATWGVGQGGIVMAISPSEETKLQMFTWSRVIFSLGFVVSGHYKDFAGDVAASIAFTNDLNG